MRSSFKSGKCNKVTSPLLLEFVMSKSIRFSGHVKVHLWKYPPDVVESQCSRHGKRQNPSESVSK